MREDVQTYRCKGAEETRPEVRELQNALYSGTTTTASLRSLLYRLKVLLVIERYRKAVTVLHVRIMGEQQMKPLLDRHPFLPADRLILQFTREENFYLIIGFVSDPKIVIATQLFLLEKPSLDIKPLHNDDDFLPPSILPYLRRDAGGHKYVPPSKRSTLASWERPLTCAIAAIDDRIGFSRVCDELKKKKFEFAPVRMEPIVGGLCLNITDVSAAMSDRCPAFFDSLVRCCLRLDSRNRLMWPFECCLVNSPLVNDFLPNKKGNRNSCLVLDLAATPHGQAVSETISTLVSERLITYCHIYDLVVRFAAVYDQYKDRCSVRHFSYHKLILTYGPHRDRLIVLNYKPKTANNPAKFIINFGQCAPVDYHIHDGSSESSMKDQRPNRPILELPTQGATEDMQWNPHAMMSTLLTDRINQEWDFTELVHYLCTTLSPLDALHNFYRFRFQSQKVFAWMLNIENFFPLAFKCHLITVTEHIIRLIYGHVHLEFAMVEDNSVFVRDVSRRGPAALGLFRFYQLMSGGTCQLTEPASVGGRYHYSVTPASVPQPESYGGALLSADSPAGGAPTGGAVSAFGGPKSAAPRLDVSNAQSPHVAASQRGPGSVPQNYRLLGTASPAAPGSGAGGSIGVVGTPATASVPPNEDSCSPTHSASRTPELTLSSAFIKVDHATHAKACAFVELGNGERSSRLDDYLASLVYIKRLGTALEVYGKLPVKTSLIEMLQFSKNIEQVRVSVASIPYSGKPLSPVHFNYHLDPATMRLKVSIEYAGEGGPSDAIISILEKYFEKCIVPLHNEMAVVSFMTLCRPTMHNAVADIARLMQAEMEPSSHSYYNVAIVHANTKMPGDPQKLREVMLNTFVEATGTGLAFQLCFRPRTRSARYADKHLIRIFYYMSTNMVKAGGNVTFEGGDDLNALLITHSEHAQHQNLCAVWPCINQLMDKMGQSRITSISTSAMPGSVGMPLSVGGPGSVAAPGSNASVRQ